MHTCDVCLNYVKNRLHKLKFNPRGLHLIDMLCLTEPRKFDKKLNLTQLMVQVLRLLACKIMMSRFGDVIPHLA